MHRWVWDLHYPSPRSTRTDYPIAAIPNDTPRSPQGPMAAPGQYSVRLSVNGHTFTEPLTVKMDPRVKASQEGLTLEFQKQKLLAGLMTQNTEAITVARSLREQIQKLTGKGAAAPGDNTASPTTSQVSGALADAVAAFDKKLSAIIGATGFGGFGAAAAPAPTLGRTGGAIAALYAEIDRSDAAPTAAQIAAIEVAQKDFSTVMKLWKDFQGTDIPALNAQLKSAGLPELQLKAPPHAAAEDDDGDIE